MEELAVDFLRSRDFIILERNFFTRRGEADIIALDQDILCFTEVKYRKDDSFGTAAEAVTARKQKRLIRTARVFLMKNPKFYEFPVRFDVLAIDGEEITLIKDAFDTTG